MSYWQSDTIVQAARGIAAPFRGRQRKPNVTRRRLNQRIQVGSANRRPRPSKATTVVTQRAMLTTEPDAANPRGKDYVGTANWRTETIQAGPGRPEELAIKLDVEIPDRGFVMTWLILPQYRCDTAG